jgi:hypothetical protein
MLLELIEAIDHLRGDTYEHDVDRQALGSRQRVTAKIEPDKRAL